MTGRSLLGFSVPLVLAIAFPVSFARAELINPSFETGDLTGWDLSFLDGFSVTDDGGSDGDHYLAASVDWTWIPMGSLGVPGVPGWHWQAGAHQYFTVPSWATHMSVDIRAIGCDLARYGAVLTHTAGPELIDLFINLTKAGDSSPAPNGFTRYICDIRAAAGLENVVLSISAWDDAAAIPADPVVFNVDNFQIIPEPAALALLVFGGLPIFGRGRRSG